MNVYERKLAERKRRYQERAEKLDRESNTLTERGMEVFRQMDGQPILVGHHSEKRHRNAIRRADSSIQRGIEASKKAAYYRGKAFGVGKAGVSSDDPDAIAKLQRKLEALEQQRDYAKRLNSYWRKHGTMKGCPGITEEAAARYDREIPEAYSWERQPVPKWKVSNLGAEIRRVSKRIESLEKAADAPEREPLELGACRVEEYKADNRVGIVFPSKPTEETRSLLKAHGFRWNRTMGAWTRKADAWNVAEFLARKIAGS